MLEDDADLTHFVIIGSCIFFLKISGSFSVRFEHGLDLVGIGLPGVIVRTPVMFGLFESESWFGILLGQLQFAACLSMVQGCMAPWEVELWMTRGCSPLRVLQSVTILLLLCLEEPCRSLPPFCSAVPWNLSEMRTTALFLH
jgi:hypothetical protein